MDSATWIGMASVITAGLTIAIGSIGPALVRLVPRLKPCVPSLNNPMRPTRSPARSSSPWPLIESTAIYALVISLILIFANPFWAQVTAEGAATPCCSTRSP
jgi:F-type H+-transporting ATPase subunit c